MFLLLKLAISVEECQIKDNNVVTENVFEICNSTRGLLEMISPSFVVADQIPINSLLKYGEPETKNGKTLDIMNYIYGLAGIVAPLVVFSLLSFIFLCSICCCGTCCGCCCKSCRRKRGKVSCVWFIFHLIFCLILAVACVFKLIFGTLFTKGIGTAMEATPQIQSTLVKVYNIFNLTIDGAIGSVDSTIYNAEDLFKTLILEVEGKTNKAVDSANKAINNIGSISLKKITKTAGSFDTKWNKIAAACPSVVEPLNLEKNIGEMDTHLDKITDQVKSFSDASDEIKSFKEKIELQLNSITSDVKSQVDKFKSKTSTFLDPITSAEKQIADIGNTMEKYITPVHKYFTTFMWIVIGIILVLTLLIIVVYFFKNCCSRTCFCCFFPLAVIYSLILLILGIAFSALFFALHDVCSVSDNAIQVFANSALGKDINTSAILVCPQPKPIYDLANMQEFFDYKKVIHDLNVSIKDMIKDVEPDAQLLERLNLTSSLDVLTQFDINNLRGFSTEEIRKILDRIGEELPTGNPCRTAFDQNIKGIKNDLSTIDQQFEDLIPFIENAKDNAFVTLEAANEFIPLIINSTNTTKTLVFDLTDNVLNIVDEGVNMVDCTLICPVYTSIINSACIYIVDSLCFEVIGIVITFIALIALSITVLNRRVNMARRRVRVDVSDDNYPNYDKDYKTKL